MITDTPPVRHGHNLTRGGVTVDDENTHEVETNEKNLKLYEAHKTNL